MTQILIVINVVGFLLQQAFGDTMIRLLALWPPVAGDWAQSSLTAPWQWLTYSVLHDNLAHIAFNMFGLWIFGQDLERVWGPRRIVLAYVASVFLGAAAQMLTAAAFGGGGVPVIGASAGVFGLMLAFALVFPERRLMLLFFPVPIPARTFVALYALLELTLGVTGTQSGVAHFAHLGGLLGGWLVYRYGRDGAGPWRRR
ncbi:MAG: rhomboid family intramembrane serine protease [Betaproteobacteria bacterium]|nr:rhomboid family intramembrane serine protease [Betaproteobacteria bacterium]